MWRHCPQLTHTHNATTITALTPPRPHPTSPRYMLDGGAPFRRDSSGRVFDRRGEQVELMGASEQVGVWVGLGGRRGGSGRVGGGHHVKVHCVYP